MNNLMEEESMGKNKINFNFETNKFEAITVEQVKEWEDAFPDADVINILTKKMPIWLKTNPQKAHKKNWKRFILNWLSRQQERYDFFRKGKQR